jgi:hypothetical protein
MKTVFTRKGFDLRGLLEASAQFFVRLGGDADFIPLYIGTIQQREERYEEAPDKFRNADEFPPHAAHFKDLERLFSEGETLVLPFAGCNVGEPVECADGRAYSVDPDKGYSGEFTSAVLLVTYAADREEILIVSGLEEESALMTSVSFREQSIGALDEAAEAFVKRFCKS